MNTAAGLALLVTAAAVATLYAGYYTVDEGHVGIIFRGGALLNYTASEMMRETNPLSLRFRQPCYAEPGFNFKIPFIDVSRQVQVTMQTDRVRNIPCGTKGGVTLRFDSIEVVNRLSASHVLDTVRNYSVNYDKPLIFDRVAHVVSEECSTSSLREIFIDKFSELDERIADSLRSTLERWSPGVEIIAVRATKPSIPNQVRANFEAVQVERTRLGIAQQAQRVMEVEAETRKLVAEIDARKNAAVSNISMARQLLEQEGKAKLSSINNDILTARSRAEADAAHYRTIKVAEADQQRLTPQFLQLQQIRALANASKVYFGDKLPSMYVDRPAAITQD